MLPIVIRMENQGPNLLIKRWIIILMIFLIVVFACSVNMTTTAVAQDNDDNEDDEDENETSDEDLAWTVGLIFVIIGIIFLLAEASSPGFFIAIPATILIILGILGIVAPGIFFSFWSPLIAVGIAIPVTLIVIYFYRQLAPPQEPVTTVGDSLIGKRGLVITATDPDSHTKGKVRIGSDTWSATSEITIQEGSRVEVIASEGVHVIVRKVK
jgi:membrane protein implicated in regulation of membrane protease activity